MGALWKPNENYKRFEPHSLEDLSEAKYFPEHFLPYERLYENLTRSKLRELLQDAKRYHWEALDLRCCGLKSLPDELWELDDLRILSLGNFVGEGKAGTDNELHEMPDAIGQLANLQLLVLIWSQISALPDSITQLKNLQSLDLSRTPISALPDCIGQLKNLQSLDLRLTQISALPDCIGQLINLKTLYLGGTPISALPDSIGQLANLQLLDLSRMQISVLPDSIRQLTNLKILDLSNCHLKEIPYSLVQLGLPFETKNYGRGNCIKLIHATLEKGDITLFSQPREVIEEYYQGRKQTVRECKVIFLGDGAVGKTSLIERIVHNNFTPGTPPTDGIEVKTMEISKWFMSVQTTQWQTTVKDQPFTLRFLDFGGQDIMHSAHRCFLTGHTVYVVVCESRDDTEIDRAAGRWLDSVHAFAPGCPVILALNKADLNPNASVNERDLRQRNPALKAILKTSAAVGQGEKYGTNRLTEAIRDEIPGAINDYRMNADMLAVKQALETMPENYISSAHYRELCAKHHITDKKLQYDLLGYFRDLGVAYFYETPAIDTRLESVRVLNPEWLTNGIYRLILRTREDGFLPHAEIKDILHARHDGDIHQEISYTPEETDFILHVMRFFQMSHDMGGGVELIPLKLPKTPPDTVDEFDRKNALHLRWEGTYLPNNLIHRLLIQKVSELDTGCVWRTGGRFRQEGGGCEAMAEMDEKALDVYVTGARDCRQYLDTFRVKIQRILTDLNLQPQEIICCMVDGQEGRIPYEDVLQQYSDRRDEIYIPNIKRYVSPAELLRDTYYNWEQEAARSREGMERGAVIQNQNIITIAPEKKDETENTKDDPDQKKKERAEIWQNLTEAFKNISEAARNFSLLFLLAAVIIACVFIPGLRAFLKELLLQLAGAL